MSNKELIERLKGNDVILVLSIRAQAADALEAADKRIAELEHRLAVAREALKKAEHTHECKARRCKEGDEWIDETKCDCCIGEALAQIGGDDAGA